MEIKESAQTFSNVIKSTKEFNELIRTKEVIEKDSSLKKQVIDFNQKLEGIYMSNSNQSAIKSQVEQLSKHYSNLTEKEEVKSFFKASDSFDQMMYQINQYINQLMQKDIMLK